MSDDHERLQTAARGEDLGLLEAMGTLLRRWQVIVVTAVVAGAVTLLMLATAVPRRWESAATLVVSPPAFSSELRPPALSLQGYQKLLESGSVIAETQRRLIERGLLDRRQPLRAGANLETRIFVSRKSEETSLTPMILVVARGRSGPQAADIANTWAQVFLEMVGELTVGATSPTIESANAQYHGAAEGLTKLDARKLEVSSDFGLRQDQAAGRWDRAIAQRQSASAGALAAYRAETSRLEEGYASGNSLEARGAQVNALQKVVADLQSEQGHVGAERAEKQLRLEAARKALAATPPVLELKKAITDDALWQAALASDKDKQAASNAVGQTLATEMTNPVYTDLATTVAHLEIGVSALVPRADQLSALVEETMTALHNREVALAQDRAAAAALHEERQAGLIALLGQQATEAAELSRDRDRETTSLKGARDNALAAIDRESAAQKELFVSLSKVHNQAMLAQTQQGVVDIRLAAPAVAPHASEPRGIALKSVLAMALGAFVGMLLALAIDARARMARA